VTEFRYRAYISYSHEDERWAAWLQNALETYRVPGRLTSRSDKKIPRRIAPVFRDREDLSSAQNLSDALISALRASESLIVICSPSAVASRWVNEEIRQFQALGRADRVLCMIVDGDPESAPGEGGCFPPALLEDSHSEPLAADPREFADGRNLAKLKLVAGLLGVRLDELRQRDLKRRRRWQLASALALAAGVALAASTVISQITQRQERAKAEQMANFVVDLGEELQSELDLESLARISRRAMEYLDGLDPKKLSPETSIRVGLALRQVGLVNLKQGKFSQSLQALERSRKLFRDLNAKYPDRDDVRFELSQAEFYVGEHYRQLGDLDAAREPWSNYYDISKSLYDSDPSNRKWLLELSYASTNLLLLRISSGREVNQALLDDMDRTVRLAERTLQAWPGNSEVLAHYSNTLAWAADAQYKACHLEQAQRYRQMTVDEAQRAAQGDPSNKVLKRNLAFRHSGMSKILTDLGDLSAAERHRRASLEILNDLLAMDPSNRLLAFNVAANERLLASLLRDTGRLPQAQKLMAKSEGVLRPEQGLESASENELEEYSEFLLDKSSLMSQLGNSDEALRALSREREIASLRERQKRLPADNYVHTAELVFLWWELKGENLLERDPNLHLEQSSSAGQYRSCLDAVSTAKLAIVRGDTETARQQADYLAKMGYRNPDYLEFCQKYGLCQP
jgi:tetratricopeptide (TPR) repeat protein